MSQHSTKAHACQHQAGASWHHAARRLDRQAGKLRHVSGRLCHLALWQAHRVDRQLQCRQQGLQPTQASASIAADQQSRRAAAGAAPVAGCGVERRHWLPGLAALAAGQSCLVCKRQLGLQAAAQPSILDSHFLKIAVNVLQLGLQSGKEEVRQGLGDEAHCQGPCSAVADEEYQPSAGSRAECRTYRRHCVRLLVAPHRLCPAKGRQLLLQCCDDQVHVAKVLQGGRGAEREGAADSTPRSERSVDACAHTPAGRRACRRTALHCTALHCTALHCCPGVWAGPGTGKQTGHMLYCTLYCTWHCTVLHLSQD